MVENGDAVAVRLDGTERQIVFTHHNLSISAEDFDWSADATRLLFVASPRLEANRSPERYIYAVDLRHMLLPGDSPAS